LAVKTIRLSDYVVGFVANLGVKHVFLVPGGGAMHLNDALSRCAAIEPVCNPHEQASAIAAENYSKATKHLGVCMVTTGPGATNAITGLAGVRMVRSSRNLLKIWRRSWTVRNFWRT